MSRSQKPQVIDHIYDELVDPANGQLTRTVVTSEDIVKAIQWCRFHKGCTLSTNNPANFMKDIIRGQGASGMWPARLHDLGIGGRQVTGDGNIFEFVRYEQNQSEPFPHLFGPHEGVREHSIQSVSMPMATKALGRDDETYLIQVAIKLALVETHFALHSPLEIVEINHLQIGIKLRLCEVDSLYAATYRDPEKGLQQLVITVEGKKRNQRILDGQIVRQVRAAFQETPVNLVVPIAMVASGGGIYVAEFRAMRRDEIQALDALELASEVLYRLQPSVKGI